MKTRRSRCLKIFFILLTIATPAAAQGVCNSSDLREQIRCLENIPIKRMSPSMLEIYERTLLRSYEQLLASIQAQLDSGRATDHVRDSLSQEKVQLVNNIAVLKISLGQPEPLPLVTPSQTDSSDASPGRVESAKPGASAPVVSAAPTQEKKPMNSASTTGASPSSPGTPPSTPGAGVVAASPPAAAPAACEYKHAPPILVDEVQKLAGSILFNSGTPEEKAQEIGTDDYKLVFYTIADALNLKVVATLPDDPTKSKTISASDLEPYRYLGETLRTDKQMGASASSQASVSRIDKPGFAWLLGLAVENGLVEKDVRNSVLTLSSSPAALYKLGNSTNPYQQAAFLNRLGVSASFNIGDQNQLLANVTRSQLNEYSVKFRFVGDRSPRSKALERIWDDKIGPNVQKRLVAINDASQFISKDFVLGPLTKTTNGVLQAKVASLLKSDDFKKDAGPNGAVTQKQIDAVAATILCYLFNNIYSQKDRVSPSAVAQFKDILFPNLVNAQLRLEAVREEIENQIDEFFKGPLGTVAYVNRRDSKGNYSEFKLLFEHPAPFLSPVHMNKFTANGGFSFYHQPDPTLKQTRTRGVNGVVSFEGSMANPFAETADLSGITFSLNGRYDRLLENSRVTGRKADLASFQFLMNFPLFKGLAFPFSITYSNATETEKRSGWRTNFGLKMDTDKLMELVRAASTH
jgi:hypothetical protein